jgi:F420-dependent oxidoreductase-like protein
LIQLQKTFNTEALYNSNHGSRDLGSVKKTLKSSDYLEMQIGDDSNQSLGGAKAALNEIKFGVFLPVFGFERMRFGVFSHVFGFGKTRFLPSYEHVRDFTLECERLGYHSVWVPDHLMYGKNPVLECWTILSALSSITRRIRLGTMVLSNSFRSPAVLAKMAATLDVISNGRLELGIGAGVSEGENLAYGIPFPMPSVRIEQMKEAVEIIKKVWTEEKANYNGKYYKIKKAICEPKPLQKPYPPIIIGGGGEKLTLRVTAEHADRYDWGFVPSMEQYKHKLKVLERHCSAVGRDFREIEKSCWPGGQVFIASDQREIDDKIARWKPTGVSLEDFKACNLVGTPSECIGKIQTYVDLGVTCFMLMFGDFPSNRGMMLFAKEVADKIKPS